MPNSPYLDASVRWRIRTGRLELEEPGYDDRVAAILSAGLATEVVRPISAGKEAEVLLCGYNGAPIAVKMYRLYRTSHKGDGPVKADAMGWRAADEFEAMHRAWKGGVRVPTPARRVEAMFSMRYLGDEDGPAPRLVDVRLEEPEPLLQEILAGIETMARAGWSTRISVRSTSSSTTDIRSSLISPRPCGWTARGQRHGSASRRRRRCSNTGSTPSGNTSVDTGSR